MRDTATAQEVLEAVRAVIQDRAGVQEAHQPIGTVALPLRREGVVACKWGPIRNLNQGRNRDKTRWLGLMAVIVTTPTNDETSHSAAVEAVIQAVTQLSFDGGGAITFVVVDARETSATKEEDRAALVTELTLRLIWTSLISATTLSESEA